MNIPTTDEMDSITADKRKALVGYCQVDQQWFKFTRGIHYERCPKCKNRFSSLNGFQIITQRTFIDKKQKRNKRS